MQVVATGADSAPKVIALELGVTVVGRNTLPVVLSSSGISVRHAEVEVVNSLRVLLTDVGRNGTHVNGVRLKPNVPTLLQDDDRIVFGREDSDAIF